VGSLKFDAAALSERNRLDVPALLRQLGVPADARLLLAGSTHAGEEAILAKQFQGLKSSFPISFLSWCRATPSAAGTWPANSKPSK